MYIFLEMWSCPNGYVMMQDKCYKVYLKKQKMMEAEVTCRNDGSILARPSTDMHVRPKNNQIQDFIFPVATIN